MRYSGLSVELGHLTLADLRLDASAIQSVIEHRVSTSLLWARPLIESFEARGVRVSTCVLVDNYFWTPDGSTMTPTQVGRALVEEYARQGQGVHHLAFEATLAETVSFMAKRIVAKPAPGSGSSLDPDLQRPGAPMWLTNGVKPRQSRMVASVGPAPTSTWEEEPTTVLDSPEVFGSGRPHSVFLDVELRNESDRPWSCAMLAAWWQLVRLGALALVDGSSVPDGTHSTADAPPLAARRTLTVIPPEYLEIEAAVRTILSQVRLGDEFRRALAGGSPSADLPHHLDRMSVLAAYDVSYLLANDDLRTG